MAIVRCGPPGRRCQACVAIMMGMPLGESTDCVLRHYRFIMGRLLIIDDEEDIARLIARAGAMSGFETRSTSDVQVFLELTASWQPNVATIDLNMPELDGVQVLRQMAERGCRSHIIIVSGMDTRTIQTVTRLGEAQGLRMAKTLIKPFRVSDIRAVLEALLHMP